MRCPAASVDFGLDNVDAVLNLRGVSDTCEERVVHLGTEGGMVSAFTRFVSVLRAIEVVGKQQVIETLTEGLSRADFRSRYAFLDPQLAEGVPDRLPT